MALFGAQERGERLDEALQELARATRGGSPDHARSGVRLNA